MLTVNEMFGSQSKGNSPAMSTYNTHEGRLDLSYQLHMTVNAKVANLTSKDQKKLVSHMKNKLGYSDCNIDKRNNTIYVYSISGINPGRILEYVTNNIDLNACELGKA